MSKSLLNTVLLSLVMCSLLLFSCDQNEVRKLMSDAKLHKADGNFSEAILLYSQVLEIDSNNADALLRRGYCHARNNTIEQALKDINLAIEIEPENNAAIYNRAGIYMQTKQYSKAIKDYSILINKGAKIENLEALYNQANDSLSVVQ